MKKLRETKANATVIVYLQQANIQTATAATQQAPVEEKPVSSQALGTLITEKVVEKTQQVKTREIAWL
eukprot:3828164-Ditylum_brightwellii.AAC.1